MKIAVLMRCLVFVLNMGAIFGAQAHTIQVQQECGFSFSVCGSLDTLVRDGSPVHYQSDEHGNPIFSLAYVGNQFVMTALMPNEVATGGSLPYGLDVYFGGMPPVQKWDCFPQGAPECAGATAIDFIAWMEFPTDPAHPLTLTIPSVPEPDAAMLAMLGLGVVALKGRGMQRTRLVRG
jgi:hypothetical protein